ncbi:MAG: hypothetical protein FWG50_00590 [Kiritimatiellaeota bacterium]|nr:hypothetical protein [Kiritimatiellota bacterium]
MKTWYLLPFMMVFGILVGRYLPKDELRTSKGQRKPIAEEAAPRNDAFNNLTRMMQIPDRASRPRRSAPRQTLDVEVGELPGEARAEAPREEGARESPRERRLRRLQEQEAFSPEDLRARIDEAKDLWMTRVAIAKAQALDKLHLSAPEQEAFFDNAINTMNESLANTILLLTEELKNGADITPELGARVINEMSSTMLTAYDDLAQLVPEERQGDVSEMELQNFIDPGVIEPLIDVQDRFEELGRQRGLR